MSKLNYTFKVIKKGKVVERLVTGKKRRFYNHARLIKWINKPLKVYLRVYYGTFKDNEGKMSNFYNEGYYFNKKDFWLALDVFDKIKPEEFEQTIN